MDIIFIEQLIVMAIIGIYEWEQQRLQKLIFDLEMGWDNHYSFIDNSISNFLDYSDVTNTVLSLINGKRFKLLECVAEKTASQLMIQFKLPWIRIKISKPGAVPQATTVGIIIERGHKKH